MGGDSENVTANYQNKKLRGVLVVLKLADNVQDGGIPAGWSRGLACHDVLAWARLIRVRESAGQEHGMIHGTKPSQVFRAGANSNAAQFAMRRFAEQLGNGAHRTRGVASG